MRRASLLILGLSLWLALELPAADPTAENLSAANPRPGVTGRLDTLDSLRLPGLLPRPLEVWLPPGYEADSARYPVIYAQDGQNLFEPARSFLGVDWGLDETLTSLIESGQVRPVIVVGIGNTPQRRRDYTPCSLYDLATPAEQATFCAEEGGPPQSVAYLDGLVSELIPMVNQRFRTLTGPRQTFLLGSSRGGLVSLEGLGRHPGVFGGAACLSTHWILAGSHLEDWLAALLPPAGAHRLYFDHGDQTLDAGYGPFQARADSLLEAQGWHQPGQRLSLAFPGHEHHERAWRQRVGPALEWLLGAPVSAP
jgi:predicted alpha/beta superfamily hydrolase